MGVDARSYMNVSDTSKLASITANSHCGMSDVTFCTAPTIVGFLVVHAVIFYVELSRTS